MTQKITMVWSLTQNQTLYSKVKWDLGSIPANKASGGDVIQAGWF